MVRFKLLLLGLLLLPVSTAAQTDDELLIQQIVEYLIETSEEELDFTDLQQSLLGNLQKPLNLNTAQFDDFKALGFLKESDILSIIEHRKENGAFLGTFELQAVAGLSAGTAKILSHFVTCDNYLSAEKTSLETIKADAGGDVILRYRTVLQDQKGYLDHKDDPDKGYQGSQHHLYLRTSYRYKSKLSLGFTAEKDAGEEFFKGSQSNGFDYYSAHAYAKDLGFVQSLALGDYQVQFGQGLVMWSGLSFSKSADVMNVVRKARKISPYRSVNENLYMRGAATTLGSKKNSVTLFYSSKKVDANLITDTLDGRDAYFTSLQVSGFHRTLAEIEDRNSITEQVIGANAETHLKGITLGGSAVSYLYEPNLDRNAAPYQIHDFEGSRLNNTGLYYNGLLKRTYIFGEWAMSNLDPSSLSTVNGAIFSLSNRVDLAALYRYYAPTYQGMYYGPFREQSIAQNESGTYIGLRFKINDALNLSAYLDRFSFNWLRFRTDLPSVGHEYLTELQYQPSKKFNLIARIRSQVKEQNLPDNTSDLNVLIPHHNTHYRFQFRYLVSKSFTTTSRLEYATYKLGDSSTSQGVLIFQDFAFKPIQKPYSLIMRYAMFNVEDYDSRIYTYEHDVLYAYSIPAYQNKGFRIYALARFKLTRRTDLWLRYAQTTYFDRDTVGSSNEEVDGNTRSEVKAQLRVRF